MSVTIWRPLIRRARLERYLRQQAEICRREGYDQAAVALLQVAENLRMGMSVGVR